MPNTDLTLETVVEEVRLSLGGSAVEVELLDDDIRGCFRKALREYNRTLPFKGRKQFAVSKAQKKYRVDDQIPGLIGIVDVQFIDRRVEPADVDPFDPYVTSLAGPNYGDETFADVDQRLMYAEDASRIISSEPEWTFQWERVEVTPGNWEQQAFIYVSIERTSVTAAYEFSAHYQFSDDVAFGLPSIPQGDSDWLIEYSVAYAKTVLSRIRGKYAGITNPEGSVDLTDYVELAQEGREDMERLMEDLNLRRPPYVPVIE